MIVVYEGCGEVIICEKRNEKKIVKEFFTNGGRVVDEYERYPIQEFINISSNIRVDYYSNKF